MDSRPKLDWIPVVLAVPVAGVVAYLGYPLPRGPVLNLATLCLLATAYLGATLAFTLALVWMGRNLVAPDERPELYETWRQASLLTAWCVPLSIYARRGSGWSIPVAIAVALAMVWVASLLRLRRVRARRPHGPLAVSLLLALVLHAGILAAILERTWLAALLLASFGGAVLWRSALRFRQDRAWPVRQGAAVLLALLVTTFSLSVYLRPGRGAGGGGNRTKPSPEAASARPGGGHGTVDIAMDTYKGVILWPEVQNNVTLVPPLPQMPSRLFNGSKRDPLTIPFFGVYWFFRPPQTAPPKGSFETRGDPARTTFRSTDFTPMRMEARQNLGITVDLDCCQAIRLAIRNSDRYPESVRVELILIDGSTQPARRMSLGSHMATTVPGGPPVSQELEFRVPPNPPIHRFDEISVRFHLAGVRTRISARMGIDRFVLLPRASL